MISPLTGIFPTLGLTVGLAKNDFWLKAYAYNLQTFKAEQLLQIFLEVLLLLYNHFDKNDHVFFGETNSI